MYKTIEPQFSSERIMRDVEEQAGYIAVKNGNPDETYMKGMVTTEDKNHLKVFLNEAISAILKIAKNYTPSVDVDKFTLIMPSNYDTRLTSQIGVLFGQYCYNYILKCWMHYLKIDEKEYEDKLEAKTKEIITILNRRLRLTPADVSSIANVNISWSDNRQEAIEKAAKDIVEEITGELTDLTTANKSTVVSAINELNTNKTSVHVVDSLTSNDSAKALSAKQGKVLNDSKQNTLTTAQMSAVNSGITSADKSKLDSIPANANHTDIVDNINSDDSTKALSAKQGKVLSNMISQHSSVEVVDNLTTADATKALSANQGFLLWQFCESVEANAVMKVNLDQHKDGSPIDSFMQVPMHFQTTWSNTVLMDDCVKLTIGGAFVSFSDGYLYCVLSMQTRKIMLWIDTLAQTVYEADGVKISQEESYEDLKESLAELFPSRFAATTEHLGLMSASDKAKLESLEQRIAALEAK